MADINGIPYVEATDLVSAYPGTSLALATELDTQLAAKSALASPTFTGTPAAPTAAVATNTTQIATTAFVLANAGGKILQIVRATDGTNHSTTSTSFVDGNMSVTITPTKSDSAVLLLTAVTCNAKSTTTTAPFVYIQITDNSNNTISGAEATTGGGVFVSGATTEIYGNALLIARATPATTSAVTFKTRFRSNSSDVTAQLENGQNTGQMYAIEVSA